MLLLRMAGFSIILVGLPSLKRTGTNTPRESVESIVADVSSPLFSFNVIQRMIPAESHVWLTAGNTVIMMKIVLMKKQEMVLITRVCNGVEKQKTKTGHVNMLISHPLTTLHTQLHIRHYRQIHLPSRAHAHTLSMLSSMGLNYQRRITLTSFLLSHEQHFISFLCLSEGLSEWIR